MLHGAAVASGDNGGFVACESMTTEMANLRRFFLPTHDI
jgi:hypothetical protein